MLKGGDTVAVIQAGLPNITGNLSQMAAAYSLISNSYTYNLLIDGAFEITGGKTKGYYSDTEYEDLITRFSFNANRSSSIYGASDTVQPPALVLLPQIKY